MSFKIHKNDDGRVPPTEYLPCSAITPRLGMALCQTGGNLVVAAGTQKPSYISLCEKTADVTAGTLIPVMRVDAGTVFITQASAAMTAVKLGDRVTLHASDGMTVTATTASGVAEVVDMEGTAVGSNILVRFS